MKTGFLIATLSIALIATVIVCALGFNTLAAQPRYSLAPGKKLLLKENVFQQGSANIEPAGRDELSFIAQYLQSVPTVNCEIGGHCDNQGNKEANQQLASARAESVKKYLVMLGVNAIRLATRSYGDTQPIAANDTEAGRAQNRRVEIVGLSGSSQRAMTTLQGKPAIEPEGRLTLVQNNVQTLAPWELDWQEADTKQPIYELHKISAGDKSRATVTFGDQSQLNIAENSIVVVYRSRTHEGNAEQREHIGLVKGGLWMKLKSMQQKQPLIVRTETSEIIVEQSGKIASDEQGRSLVSVHEGNARVSEVAENHQPTATIVEENYGTRVAAGSAPETPRQLPPAPVLEIADDSTIELSAATHSFRWLSTAPKIRFELVAPSSNRVLHSMVTEAPSLSIPLQAGSYVVYLTAIDAVGLESKRVPYTVHAVIKTSPAFRWIEFFLFVGAVGLFWSGFIFKRRLYLYTAFALATVAVVLFIVR